MNIKNRKGKIYLGIALVVVIGGIAIVGSRDQIKHNTVSGFSRDGVKGASVENEPKSASSNTSERRKPISKKERTGAADLGDSALEKIDIPEYLANGGDVTLLASSRQEALWLSEHGFPTPDDVQKARAMSLSRLKALANTGSAKFAYLYGHELMMRHGCMAPGGGLQNAPCAQAFRKASILGSLPAMIQYPSFYANATGGADGAQMDRVNAWAKLAYILGEPSAGGAPASFH